MSVDFGLICLFTIQLALVFLCYHAWKGIKAEISALEALRQGNAAVTSRLDAITAKMEALGTRVSEVETAPKAGKARMEELADSLARSDRKADAIESKVTSLAARVSAYARHRKSVNEDEETDPAPEGEGLQIPLGQMPPGSFPLNTEVPRGTLPPGFGVTGRKARHG